MGRRETLVVEPRLGWGDLDRDRILQLSGARVVGGALEES